MDKRKLELENLKSYTQKIENEVTLMLQNLQWDSNHLLKSTILSTCKYDKNHKIPPDKKEVHERKCFLTSHGYCKDDVLLPEPLDCRSNSLVMLSTDKISQIIDNAAKADPFFKKGSGMQDTVALSLERLQWMYTADERRAIHNAVVQAVPSCHDLADLALFSSNAEDINNAKAKTRTEILAELRDMKRRRTKYRVAAKTKNYSDALRDVIKTQMELYAETHAANESQYENGNYIENSSTDKYLNQTHLGNHRPEEKNSFNIYNGENSRNYLERDNKYRYNDKIKREDDIDRHTYNTYDDRTRNDNESRYQKYGKEQDIGVSSKGFRDYISDDKYHRRDDERARYDTEVRRREKDSSRKDRYNDERYQREERRYDKYSRYDDSRHERKERAIKDNYEDRRKRKRYS